MPRFLRIVMVLVVLVALIAWVGLTVFNRGMDEVMALDIGSVDIAELPDGIYEGDYTQNRWSYSVQVAVNSGRIRDITITHSNHEGIVGGWNEAIIAEILQKQSLDIQGVSGATATTRALQRAVENALRKN